MGHLNRARRIFPLNLTESGVLKRAYEILMWNCLPCDSAVFTAQQSGLRGLAYTIAVTKEQQLIRVRRGGDKTVKACCWLWASSQQMQTKGFVTRITLPLPLSFPLSLSLSLFPRQAVKRIQNTNTLFSLTLSSSLVSILLPFYGKKK